MSPAAIDIVAVVPGQPGQRFGVFKTAIEIDNLFNNAYLGSTR
jgi:hypothetical protein